MSHREIANRSYHWNGDSRSLQPVVCRHHCSLLSRYICRSCGDRSTAGRVQPSPVPPDPVVVVVKPHQTLRRGRARPSTHAAGQPDPARPPSLSKHLFPPKLASVIPSSLLAIRTIHTRYLRNVYAWADMFWTFTSIRKSWTTCEDDGDEVLLVSSRLRAS
jgi:hypothetical protein